MKRIIFKIFWKLSLFIPFFLASCSKQEPCEIVQVRPLTRYHKVKEGEKLKDIAEQYQMSTKELSRLNGIGEQALLVPGQKIFIIAPNTQSISSQGTIVEINKEGFYTQQEQESVQTLGDKKTIHEQNSLYTGGEETLDYQEDDLINESSPRNPVSNADFSWPIKGKILRKFNETLPNGSLSEGMNISAPLNASVRACLDGTVLDAGELVLGFGKMIILSHNNGMISIYGHLQEILVKRPHDNEVITIKKGQVIGKIGKSGNVRVPQLHFQLRNEKKIPIDPMKYLSE